MHGNGNGFTVFCLDKMNIKAKCEMEIEITSGKRQLPNKTGEIMSIYLARENCSTHVKLFVLFGMGLFAVNLPDKIQEGVSKPSDGKFKF